MKTSELIAALAADPVPEPIRLGRRVAAALALGLVGALALYALFVGPRPDFAEAVRTMRFDLKFVDALALALPSLLLRCGSRGPTRSRARWRSGCSRRSSCSPRPSSSN